MGDYRPRFKAGDRIRISKRINLTWEDFFNSTVTINDVRKEDGVWGYWFKAAFGKSAGYLDAKHADLTREIVKPGVVARILGWAFIKTYRYQEQHIRECMDDYEKLCDERDRLRAELAEARGSLMSEAEAHKWQASECTQLREENEKLKAELERVEKGRQIAMQAFHESTEREVKLRAELHQQSLMIDKHDHEYCQLEEEMKGKLAQAVEALERLAIHPDSEDKDIYTLGCDCYEVARECLEKLRRQG
jgi:hypothetical protein